MIYPRRLKLVALFDLGYTHAILDLRCNFHIAAATAGDVADLSSLYDLLDWVSGGFCRAGLWRNNFKFSQVRKENDRPFSECTFPLFSPLHLVIFLEIEVLVAHSYPKFGIWFP